MAREILLSKKAETGLRLDPRTKLLLIFIISIFVMGGTGGEAMGLLRLVLCAIPALLLLFSKQFGKAVGYIVIFAAFYAVQISVLPHLTGILNFLVLFTTGFFCRILPSVAMAAYAVKTTTVSELISGMERIHMPMVMQDTSHQLFTESVTDEVLLSMDDEDETIVNKILKQFDLLEYKDRHPLSLSGGQKQRVAIASAIVSNREIIVFDEPTSGLDLKHMREVARGLKSLADQGKTLLVITHDPELVMAGCSYGWGLSISHKAAYNTLLRLRVSLQKKFEKLPLGIVEEKGTGTIKKLFVDDVDSLELLLAHSVPEGIANLLIPLVIYIAMFCADWKLALMSLASIPISLLSMVIMYSVGMKRMGPYYQSAQKMNNTIIEYINGMEVVKVFNRESESYENFRNDVMNYRDYTLAWYKAAWPWMAIYGSLLPCTVILTLPLGAWFVLCGISTLPDLILVLCLSLSIGIPLLKALSFMETIPNLNYKITALEQTLNAAPLQAAEDDFHGQDFNISYDHVSFAYQTAQPGPDGNPIIAENEVLHDITFVAKAGQKTALVGESGSGKSTLAKLLIHYYDPQKGSISIGGQKLCDMSLEALNSRISYVAQDQYLFNTSLLENIRLGRLNATDEEVMEAAKKAQCMEFLKKLPQGIHSMAGDAGKMLSGGQRQRISLARAILKDAPIVVLDEATAYADPENEEKMEAAIAELVKGKTLIVIAHKLPAIMNADQICVMDHGNLVATGKHQELIQSCPEYQKLWKAAQDSSEWKVSTAKEGR